MTEIRAASAVSRSASFGGVILRARRRDARVVGLIPGSIHAQALVYVLEGSIVMQVRGGEPVTLAPGQTFYEGPDDVHIVGRNASDTAPAKLLVFLVKDKGAPILTPVK